MPVRGLADSEVLVNHELGQGRYLQSEDDAGNRNNSWVQNPGALTRRKRPCGCKTNGTEASQHLFRTDLAPGTILRTSQGSLVCEVEMNIKVHLTN